MAAPSASAPAAATPGLTPPTRRGRSPRRLGEIVVDLGYATSEQVEKALGSARVDRKLLGTALVEHGVIDPDQLARAMAERFGLDHVDLLTYPVDMEAAQLVPAEVAKRYGAVAIGWARPGALLVAMADPANVVATDDLGMLTGHDIVPAIATPSDLDLFLRRLVRLDEAVTEPEPEPEEIELRAAPEDEGPVVKLVNSIIARAIEHGASDIHFTPQEGDLRVQFRVDGVLHDGLTVPRRLQSGVVTRAKILADLDISERRVPQDGRFGLTVEGRPVDVRMVTLPLVDGESMVMRILDRSGTTLTLDALGMLPDDLERFSRSFQRPYGAVLVTGPTGSGKTTSLYAALSELKETNRSIVTIEDPVEYRLQGLRQLQVNQRTGVTFATGLRAMMRADPDVVMVGEIRDRETAQIAVESALTGHLVLSTLHTNDAPTAITRLVEMGIEPFLVASCIDCVVAQRLARRLCENCRREHEYSAEVLRASGWDVSDDLRAFEAVGCNRCGGSGYKSRVGLYEVMPMTEEVRNLALGRATAAQIAEEAVRHGMSRLRDDGLAKVRRGETSLAEVARVTVAT